MILYMFFLCENEAGSAINGQYGGEEVVVEQANVWRHHVTMARNYIVFIQRQVLRRLIWSICINKGALEKKFCRCLVFCR